MHAFQISGAGFFLNSRNCSYPALIGLCNMHVKTLQQDAHGFAAELRSRLNLEDSRLSTKVFCQSMFMEQHAWHWHITVGGGAQPCCLRAVCVFFRHCTTSLTHVKTFRWSGFPLSRCQCHYLKPLVEARGKIACSPG